MAVSKIDPKTLNVAILGYTGETGKALTNLVLKDNIFRNVSLIGRRIVEYKDDFYKNGTQKQVDFEKLSDYEETFKGLDVVYCCLGTTRGKSGADGFVRVDFDYVFESAKLAKKVGCKQFHLVSSMGANKNSTLLYPKTKGEIEEAVSKLGFDRCAVYRPAMLMCDREERRVAEAIARCLIKPIQWIAPTWITTPVETLAKAMVNNTINTQPPTVEIIENAKIFQLASLDDKKN